jgi:hypothetical protein
MRLLKNDEAMYKHAIETSRDADKVSRARGALDEIRYNMQLSIKAKLTQADDRVLNLERTIREERTRQGN